MAQDSSESQTPTVEAEQPLLSPDKSDSLDEKFRTVEREIAMLDNFSEPTPPMAVKRVRHEDIALEEEGTNEKVLCEMQPASSMAASAIRTSPPTSTDDLYAVLKGVDNGSDVNDEDVGGGRDSSSASIKEEVIIEGEGQYQILEIDDAMDGGEGVKEECDLPKEDVKAKAIVPTKQHPKAPVNSVAVLTNEEDRAVAIQQMACLKKERERQRKRKLEAAKSVAEVKPHEVIANEWSDDSCDVEASNTDSKDKANEAQANGEAKDTKEEDDKGSLDNSNPNEAVATASQGEETQGQQSPPTNIRRTRVIKRRRIIWDPDAPETQFKYSQAARRMNTTNSPKAGTSANTANNQKGAQASTSTAARKQVKSTVRTDAVTPTQEQTDDQTVATPKPNGLGSASSSVKKKKFSEIDRLMQDEGAANMVNALKQEQNSGNEHNSRMRRHVSTEKTTTTVTPTAPAPAPKVVKRNARSTSGKRTQWDFVYGKNGNVLDENAMIARRRSSSNSSNVSNRTDSNANVSAKEEKPPSFVKPNAKRVANDTQNVVGLTVTKRNKVVCVCISPKKTRQGCVLTAAMVTELSKIFIKSNNDDECLVVTLTSKHEDFIQGIDVVSLLDKGNDEELQKEAHKLFNAVKALIKALINFKKPIVAGVSGEVKDIGVIILALCDVVVAGSNTTFEVPQVRRGQLPEGRFVWALSPKIPQVLMSKLFLLGERVECTDFCASGIIHSTVLIEDVSIKTESIGADIAKNYNSCQQLIKNESMSTLKKNVQKMDEEIKVILGQWSSAEYRAQLKEFY